MKPAEPGEAPASPGVTSLEKMASAEFAASVSPGRGLPLSAVGSDILYGAGEIAAFLFGDPKHRRRVYHLVERNGLPVFRIGINICARKSVLLSWIEAQEQAVSSAASLETACQE